MNLWHRFLMSPHKPEWLQTIATLAVTIVLARLTRYYVKVTAAQVKANLLVPLLVEYGSPDMGVAIRRIKAWQVRYGYNFFEEAFRRALSTADPAELAKFTGDREEALAIDAGARRMLSHYFFRIRALCEHDLVDAKLMARVLGPEPMDFYLEAIDPLDQAQRAALHRKPTKETHEFFTNLRKLAPEE
jgi:hypothetical protein